MASPIVELLLPVQLVPKRLALDERHDVVEQAVAAARVEQGEDVGVLEFGGDPDLAEKAIAAEGGGELGQEHLDGDLTIVADVVGEVDDGHAAPTELPSHRVVFG